MRIILTRFILLYSMLYYYSKYSVSSERTIRIPVILSILFGAPQGLGRIHLDDLLRQGANLLALLGTIAWHGFIDRSTAESFHGYAIIALFGTVATYFVARDHR